MAYRGRVLMKVGEGESERVRQLYKALKVLNKVVMFIVDYQHI